MVDIRERDTLGAFARHTHAELRGQGAGPLSGLAFAAKDLYDVAGHRTGFGSPDWLASHAPATRTALAVMRVLEAGADMVGRTQSDEMAWSLFGENAHYGTPVNPAAPGRIPGGSSSGSASAVAGGLVDFALGSDTGGSVRFPASLCGVFGMRPTHGRIPLDGACPLAPSFDTVGWFARDAEMLARVGRVLLAESSAAEPPSRVIVADDAFGWAGPAVTDALAPAVSRVERALGHGNRMSLGGEGFAAWAAAFRDLQSGEIWAVHGEWVVRTHPTFGPGVRERFDYARSVTAEQVAAARAVREALAARLDRLLAGGTILVLPTAPGIAPLCGSDPRSMNDFRARCLGLLSPAGLARLPQVTLPLGQVEGCPVGLSLVGARNTDLALLEAVRAVMDPSME